MDKMSYDEAVAQLGAIVSRMEDPNVGITEVKDLIKRANGSFKEGSTNGIRTSSMERFSYPSIAFNG